MHVGLDLDNTIVNYDNAFYLAGREKNLIPEETVPTKIGVKSYLCETGREEDWTGLQGYVYGPGIKHASLFPGFRSFLEFAGEQCWKLTIISHKTRQPYIGPQYDLHSSATAWLESAGVLQQVDTLHFETSKIAKLKRITDEAPQFFIDDLPEILNHSNFPSTTQPILFDPWDRLPASIALPHLQSWHHARHLIES